MNDHSPLHFHSVHGSSINICQNGLRAQPALTWMMMGMGSTDDSPVVFSHRPVNINERIYLRFAPESVNSSSLEHLIIGFTNFDPATLSTLPRVATQHTIPGYWLYVALLDNGLFHFYVNDSGHVYVSNKSGPCISNVNTKSPMWAVIGVRTFPVVLVPVSPAASPAVLPVRPPPQSLSIPSTPVDTGACHRVPASSPQNNSEGLSTTTDNQQLNSRTSNQSSTERNQLGDQISERSESVAPVEPIGDQRTSRECIICCTNAADTAFTPCGHLYTCYTCALDVWQGRGGGLCPVCKQTIINTLRIYC